MSLETVRFPVSGMSCGNCARTVERKLASTPGVSKATVDLAGASATVEFDPSVTDLSRLTAAVQQVGYQVPATS